MYNKIMHTTPHVCNFVFTSRVDLRLNHFLTAIEPNWSLFGSRKRLPHSECVATVFFPAKKQRGKIHQDLIQTHYTLHCEKYVKFPIIFDLYPKKHTSQHEAMYKDNPES